MFPVFMVRPCPSMAVMLVFKFSFPVSCFPVFGSLYFLYCSNYPSALGSNSPSSLSAPHDNSILIMEIVYIK